MQVEEAEIVLDIYYCNDTMKEEKYDPTRYGKITARDRFFDLREEAKRNETVFARFPHIIRLRFVQPEELRTPLVEEYVCPCGKVHEDTS